MPVMDEQMRKERAKRLLQLRFEEGMSPADAWHVVDPASKAKDSGAAELTRREIRWLRDRERRWAEALKEDRDGLEAGGLNGALPNGTSAEVTRAAAVKRCAGVAGRPCEKEITGRSPRCEDCRKEHTRRRRQVENRNSHLRNKEAREERDFWRRLVAALRYHLARLQGEEERRRQEAEKRRKEELRKRQEAERRRREEVDAALVAIRAEVEAKRKAEEERRARMPRHRMVGYGRSITEYPDGRRKLHDLLTGRSKMLEPGEPIPVYKPRWAG